MSDTMNEALRVLAEHGRKLVEAAEHPLENEHPSDVEAAEDVWSGGEENIMLNIDHAEATHGADPQVTEPEVMDITELKAIVEEVVNELDEYAMALDKMDADVPDMVINHLLENGPSEAMNVAMYLSRTKGLDRQLVFEAVDVLIDDGDVYFDDDGTLFLLPEHGAELDAHGAY